jgi:hypothetical protein
MTLDAIDAVRRGLANLRANWQLVLLQWAAGVAMMALAVASLLPPLLGLTGLWPSSSAAGAGRFRSLRASWRSDSLAGAVLPRPWRWCAILGWLCKVQANTMGVLVSSDRRAGGASAGWRRFAVFSSRSSGLAPARLAVLLASTSAWRRFILGLMAGLASR